MLTALEFINVEQIHKKNSALLAFHLSSAIVDHILYRIGISTSHLVGRISMKYLNLVLAAFITFASFCVFANKQNADHNALDYIKHNEIYNPEAVIPSQCYTKTEGKNNPCYACHQTYKHSEKRPNIMNDGDLQGDYQFSDEGMNNSWKNLFIDRSDLIKGISDDAILAYVNQDNYGQFAHTHPTSPQANAMFINNLAYPEKAFNQQGLAKDNSHWVAFNYKPFPSTFWPTNGSTGDAMIRLPSAFREINGEFNLDVYFANLSLVEMAIKELPTISTPEIDERIIKVDLNNDGTLGKVTQIHKQSHYLGDAKQVPLHSMLYPKGTEFLHTVRYLGVNAQGEIYNAPRMKEVRYMKKHGFKSANKLRGAYTLEAKEKEFEQLPKTISIGERGIDNGFSWTINGYIEDQQGKLRPQHYQELMFCNGCHKTVGTTIDQTFSFPRKVEGKLGWRYIDLKAQKDVPTLGESQGEFLTYLQRVGGGDEFRQNQEMLLRWFDSDGTVKRDKVANLSSIYELIMPSKERALKLNKAYKTIVQEQSFLFGRDANISKAKNVLEQVDDKQAPLAPEHHHKWDIRLAWLMGEDNAVRR